MRRFLSLLAGVILLSGCSWFGVKKAVNPDPNHTHADFAVWIDNVQIDFSAEKYMSVPPSTAFEQNGFWDIPVVSAHEDGENTENMIPGREYLHLHDGNGHVIHRHKMGLTFGDFLESIGFNLMYECTESDTAETTCDYCLDLDTGESVCDNREVKKNWQMFVNGQEVLPVNPDYDFQDLDQILLTYGATPEQVTSQLATLTDNACLYSQTCPERGPPPVENCIADPEVPCMLPPQ